MPHRRHTSYVCGNYNKIKLNKYKYGIIINFIHFKILFLLIYKMEKVERK